MANTAYISARIPKALLDSIEAEARRERRSLSQLVLMALEGKYGVNENHKGCPSCGALTGHQKWCKA